MRTHPHIFQLETFIFNKTPGEEQKEAGLLHEGGEKEKMKPLNCVF